MLLLPLHLFHIDLWLQHHYLLFFAMVHQQFLRNPSCVTFAFSLLLLDCLRLPCLLLLVEIRCLIVDVRRRLLPHSHGLDRHVLFIRGVVR